MGTKKDVETPNKVRDSWDKADIILKIVGPLITALTIALVSLLASSYLSHKQDNEAKTKLYTELMSKREESESALRKDMFNSIINNILKTKDDPANIDEKILQLEMLTYNFHESLNLMPIFYYLDRRIKCEVRDSASRVDFMGRLKKLSRDVMYKQIGSLDRVAEIQTFVYTDTLFSYKDCYKYYADSAYKYTIDSLYDKNKAAFIDGIDTIKSCTFLDSIMEGSNKTYLKQKIRIEVKEYDPYNNTVNVSLKIHTENGKTSDRNPEFTIDYFEFPMIDNTPLENDKRLAVVLSDFDVTNPAMHRIELKVLYFPGSHSSLKDKPYFDDIVAKLLPKE